MTEMTDPITFEILGACLSVHTELGPGLLESAYEDCLAQELRVRGIQFQRQPLLTLTYRKHEIPNAFRPDFLFEHAVLELKAIQEVRRVHLAQLRTYVRLTRRPVGLLVNFNVCSLTTGIHRLES